MKRVLITGGAGFIAHHLIKYLLDNTDWDIISLDRLDYSGNLNRFDNISWKQSILELHNPKNIKKKGNFLNRLIYDEILSNKERFSKMVRNSKWFENRKPNLVFLQKHEKNILIVISS